jgi:hypothetical protein
MRIKRRAIKEGKSRKLHLIQKTTLFFSTLYHTNREDNGRFSVQMKLSIKAIFMWNFFTFRPGYQLTIWSAAFYKLLGEKEHKFVFFCGGKSDVMTKVELNPKLQSWH